MLSCDFFEKNNGEWGRASQVVCVGLLTVCVCVDFFIVCVWPHKGEGWT